MKRLIYLLALGIPLSASSVTYTLATPEGYGFRATASDFLPVLYPSSPTFFLAAQAHLDYVNCGASSTALFTCNNALLTREQTGSTAIIRIGGDSFDYSIVEAFFASVDLAHVGQWKAANSETTLTITREADVAAEPVVSPEPSSFLLLALGLVGVKASLRLFYSTVNSEVVISPSR